MAEIDEGYDRDIWGVIGKKGYLWLSAAVLENCKIYLDPRESQMFIQSPEEISNQENMNTNTLSEYTNTHRIHLQNTQIHPQNTQIHSQNTQMHTILFFKVSLISGRFTWLTYKRNWREKRIPTAQDMQSYCTQGFSKRMITSNKLLSFMCHSCVIHVSFICHSWVIHESFMSCLCSTCHLSHQW